MAYRSSFGVYPRHSGDGQPTALSPLGETNPIWAAETCRRPGYPGPQIPSDTSKEAMVKRWDTFTKSWPHWEGNWEVLCPRAMAAAGFCFTPFVGHDDAVTCFACGVTIDRWLLAGEPVHPLRAHRDSSPGCPFLGRYLANQQQSPSRGRTTGGGRLSFSRIQTVSVYPDNEVIGVTRSDLQELRERARGVNDLARSVSGGGSAMKSVRWQEPIDDDRDTEAETSSSSAWCTSS